MKRPLRGDMPIALTLPLHLDLRLRTRQRRWRRLAVGVLIALGVALLAAGLWLPAKAGASARLATLEIGDILVVERPDGSTMPYEVMARDVVDVTRAELQLDAVEGSVVLVTNWPFEAVEIGGTWRYVVTARLVALSCRIAPLSL
jgi:hypothetical protein